VENKKRGLLKSNFKEFPDVSLERFSRENKWLSKEMNHFAWKKEKKE